jgi:hypothetical protein
MPAQALFSISVAFGFIAWGIVDLYTSGRYFALRRASMPCVLSSSCTVSALSGSPSW